MLTKLSQLGEFGLIDLLKKYKGGGASVIKGIGDDTAVVPLDAKRYLLLTTDMLMEGVHFKRSAPPRSIGHKALACSISDIAAMGGLPRYALVSLGVPGNLSWAFVRDLYQGMDTLARKFGIAIVGGDTIKSARLVINVALTGEVNKTDVVYRNGARPGDRIFVTGALGKSLSTGRHLKFTPRVKESQYLVRHVKPTSMIDISDGLTADLGHILEESKAGAVLEEKRIPRRAGAGLRQALYDGEDFELLFTVPARKAALLRKNKFYPIGEIVARGRGLSLQDKTGKLTKIRPRGYTHF
ncbi:MAG: thiamine-phosphate kinase [Candidatus Omnitrophica bacterium]|nr:thiamine-phosphate kinase [Candidatus Omnitrophota bacterium]